MRRQRRVRWPWALATLLALAAPFPAAGSVAPPATAPAAGTLRAAGPQTLAFDCAREPVVVLVVGPNATVLLADRGVTLRPVAAAAGVRRFAEGSTTLELRPDGSARWRAPLQGAVDCVARPERVAEARARLRGALLVGFGAGATWRVEIVPDADGTATVRLDGAALAAPRQWARGVRRSGAGAAGSVFEAAQPSPIRIELGAEACRDPRLEGPGRVIRVTLDGRALDGCAWAPAR